MRELEGVHIYILYNIMIGTADRFALSRRSGDTTDDEIHVFPKVQKFLIFSENMLLLFENRDLGRILYST